jgi:hypothetical protein
MTGRALRAGATSAAAFTGNPSRGCAMEINDSDEARKRVQEYVDEYTEWKRKITNILERAKQHEAVLRQEVSGPTSFGTLPVLSFAEAEKKMSEFSSPTDREIFAISACMTYLAHFDDDRMGAVELNLLIHLRIFMTVADRLRWAHNSTWWPSQRKSSQRIIKGAQSLRKTVVETLVPNSDVDRFIQTLRDIEAYIPPPPNVEGATTHPQLVQLVGLLAPIYEAHFNTRATYTTTPKSVVRS